VVLKESKPLGNHRHMWEDNIQWVINTEWEGVNSVHLAQGRGLGRAFLKTVTNLISQNIQGISRLADQVSRYQEGF
jgi:hypothetical protein